MTWKNCRTAAAWGAIATSTLAFTQLGPALIHTPGQTLGQTLVPAAYAQAWSDDEVASYARTVVSIEERRLPAYESASDILTSANSELSILALPLSCTATRMSDMPDIPRADRLALRTVLVEFCNEASAIAEENELTPKRFNSITAAHREDEELAGRIQAALGAL